MNKILRSNVLKTVIFCMLVTLCFIIPVNVTTAQAAKKTKIKVKSVKITNVDNKIVIKKGQTKTLKVKVSPKNAKNKKIKWTSSNKKILTVNSKGKIKGKKAGKAYVYATARDGSKKKARIRITVGTKVSSIKFANASELQPIVIGKTFKLKASVSPSNATRKTLKWSSSKPSVATVSKGTVKAKSNGTTTIKAVSIDGTKKSRSIKVSVITLVKSVKIQNTADSSFLRVGDSLSFESQVSPTSASNKALTWTSSNTGVAKVSNKGVVKAVASGTTTIKATAKDGSKRYSKYTINVIRINKKNNTVIAHRGFSTLAPENSKSAFQAAVDYGFWGVECDVRITKDGQFVIRHDDSLLDTFGVNKKISESNYDDIKDLVMKEGANIDIYKEEKLPTLADYMKIVSESETIRPIIDLKSSYSKSKITELLNMITEYGINDRITLSSSTATNLVRIKSVYDEIESSIIEFQPQFVRPKLLYLTSSPSSPMSGHDTKVDWCIENKINISINYAAATQKIVDKMHDAGLTVGVYTINNFYTAFTYLYGVGVDTITTDVLIFD